MSAIQRRRPAPRTARLFVEGAATAGASVAALALAFLVAGGRWVLALIAVLAVPVANHLLRQPGTAVAIWLALTPLVVLTEGGEFRQVYWVVHRLLPPAALLAAALGGMLRPVPRRMPRPAWPELAMAGYLVLSLWSILHSSADTYADLVALYDRVAVPMCLYLLVRLLKPGERELRRLLPVVVLVLGLQAAIGIASWVAPDVLPAAWLGRAGSRTTGSLRNPNVYGTTVLVAGLFVLHHHVQASVRRPWLGLLPPVALLMVFLTHSRASWLAALVVLAGVAALYPRSSARLGAVVALAAVALLATTSVVASPLVQEQVETAQRRLASPESEASALSRLPVVRASFLMFLERPLTGWGYGSFDRVSPGYQGRVGDWVVPRRHHASHNLYLTILAEQGIPGLVLYLTPVIAAAVTTPAAWRRLPRDGLVSRKLLAVLWLAVASHVVVNTYSNMKVVYGLGIWWLLLGMIATLAAQARDAGDLMVRP